jgi:hypothetical protein
MKKTFLNIVVLLSSLFTITLFSCVKDPQPDPVVEQEEIDSISVYWILLLGNGTPGADTFVVNINKAGVAQPNPLNLQSGTTYKVLLNLYNKGAWVNEEIVTEGVEHQFFFFPSTTSGITAFEYLDKDTEQRPLGLANKIQIGTGTFYLNVILRHSLDKASAHAQNYNSATYQQAGGEEDLNFEFAIEAQ